MLQSWKRRRIKGYGANPWELLNHVGSRNGDRALSFRITHKPNSFLCKESKGCKKYTTVELDPPKPCLHKSSGFGFSSLYS